MGAERKVTATENVGAWGGVGAEDCCPVSTARGTDGKAGDVGKGEESPCPAVSLQGNWDGGVVCIWESNLLCVCFGLLFAFFPTGQEIGQAVRGEHQVSVLPQCKLLPEYVPAAPCLELGTDESIRGKLCFLAEAGVWCIKHRGLAGLVFPSCKSWALTLLTRQVSHPNHSSRGRKPPSAAGASLAGSPQHGSLGSSDRRPLVPS